MTYELAQQLRQAGFPQRGGLDGANLASHIKFGFPIYACVHGNKCNKQCETEVFYPKLGEIIEACGEDFEFLHYQVGHMNKSTADKNLFWIAKSNQFEAFIPDTWTEEYKLSRIGSPEHRMIVGSGSTPEESVARLWLSLHNKDNEKL